MLQILFAEYRLLYWYAPINAKRLVLDIDAAIGLGMIELIALVLEDGSFGENGKAMGKATRMKNCNPIRDEELGIRDSFSHCSAIFTPSSSRPVNRQETC